jgi:hypothetical protein
LEKRAGGLRRGSGQRPAAMPALPASCGVSSKDRRRRVRTDQLRDPEKRFFVTAVTSPAHIPQVNFQGSPSRNYTPARAPRPTALRSRGLRSVGANFTSNQSGGTGACCRGGELVPNYTCRIKLAADSETIQETNCGLETQQHHGNRFWSRYWVWLQHH